MASRLPSLQLLLETVQGERDRQLKHFDGLDNNAGFALGFSGILATLSLNVPGVFRLAGLVATVTAGGFALWAFWPRGFPALELAALREYLAAEEQFTKLTLHDTLITMDREASDLVKAKAGRLKSALSALALAVFIFAVGIASEGL